MNASERPLTTEFLLDFLKTNGAALAGVASITPLLTDERYKKNVKTICPNAQAVIVFANEFPQSVLDACPENTRPARYTLNCLYKEGETICLKTARQIEKFGYRAVIIPAYLPVEMSYETLGLKGDLNLKHAAVEAGLGSRGVNDLVITSEFGPRIRLFGLITDAPLTPTPKSSAEQCTKCGACAKACPSGAISFKIQDSRTSPNGEPVLVETGADPLLCAPYSMKNGLPDLVQLIKLIENEPDPTKRFKKLRGLDLWRHWQALSQGTFYECFECIRSCPVGRVKFNK